MIAAVLLAACARPPAPKDPTERALYKDLERQVTVAAATGWSVDRLEVEELLEGALDSVCRVDGLGRRGLREWLDAQIALNGGISRRRGALAARSCRTSSSCSC